MLQRVLDFHKLVPFHRKLYYKWRSLRNVPFRNKFFVGYDLDGNTYWEFILDKSASRPRRLFEPRLRQTLIHDYFNMIPIPWAQWLRHSRKIEPSLEELAKEEMRVEQLKARAAFRDQEQQWNSTMADQRIQENLNKELHRLENQKQGKKENDEKRLEGSESDPWKAAQAEEKSIETSTVQPSRRG